MTLKSNPFGGEAEVFYLAILEQMEKQRGNLSIADAYSVLNFMAQHELAHLYMNVQATVLKRMSEEKANEQPNP